MEGRVPSRPTSHPAIPLLVMRTVQQRCGNHTPLAGMEPGPPQVGMAAGMCAFIRLLVLADGFTISDNPKVIPQPVDTQSSAEHLIGVKTMSDAFREF